MNEFVRHLQTTIFPLLEKNDVGVLIQREKEINFYIMMSYSTQKIDYAFHRITKIEIEEMHYNLTIEAEIDRIFKLKPPFNHETNDYDKEVDNMIAKRDKIGMILLKHSEENFKIN